MYKHIYWYVCECVYGKITQMRTDEFRVIGAAAAAVRFTRLHHAVTTTCPRKCTRRRTPLAAALFPRYERIHKYYT